MKDIVDLRGSTHNNTMLTDDGSIGDDGDTFTFIGNTTTTKKLSPSPSGFQHSNLGATDPSLGLPNLGNTGASPTWDLVQDLTAHLKNFTKKAQKDKKEALARSRQVEIVGETTPKDMQQTKRSLIVNQKLRGEINKLLKSEKYSKSL